MLTLLCLITSCKTETYADKRKAEKKKWNSYVSDNNLNLSTDSAYCFSLPTPWPDNLYFKTCRGAYIHLISDNKEARHPEEGNEVILRYIAYDLDGEITGGNTPPADFTREGDLSVYSKGGSSPCVGWNDCYACMHHGTEAYFLIDSQLGPEEQYDEVITLKMHVVDFTVTN